MALDQLANTLFCPLLNKMVAPGGARFGFPDETLSSVFAKNVRLNKCKICVMICKVLHFFDKGHCENSIELDEGDPIK